jgi:hypothetical protein
MPGDGHARLRGFRAEFGVDTNARDGRQRIAAEDERQSMAIPGGNPGFPKHGLEGPARTVRRDLEALPPGARAHTHFRCSQSPFVDAGALGMPENERAMRQRKDGFAAPRHIEALGSAGCSAIRPRCTPISTPAWARRTTESPRASRSWSSIAASRADDGAGTLAPQEPAQQIPRTVRRKQDQRIAPERCAIERGFGILLR